MIYNPMACLKLLADTTEYAERFADTNDEPAHGDCRKTVALAKSLLADAAKAPAIPHRFMAELLAYVEHYQPPGQFVMAVVTNDLVRASAGPHDAIANLPAFIEWLHKHAPAASWGTVDRARRWIAKYNDGIQF